MARDFRDFCKLSHSKIICYTVSWEGHLKHMKETTDKLVVLGAPITR